jgi:hypothetical protein
MHHRHIVRTLHSLSTREPAETRDMPSGVFFLSTYINEIHYLLLAPGHHRLKSRDV